MDNYTDLKGKVEYEYSNWTSGVIRVEGRVVGHVSQYYLFTYLIHSYLYQRSHETWSGSFHL